VLLSSVARLGTRLRCTGTDRCLIRFPVEARIRELGWLSGPKSTNNGTEQVIASKLNRIYAPRIVSDHMMVQEDFERLHKFLLETESTRTSKRQIIAFLNRSELQTTNVRSSNLFGRANKSGDFRGFCPLGDAGPNGLGTRRGRKLRGCGSPTNSGGRGLAKVSAGLFSRSGRCCLSLFAFGLVKIIDVVRKRRRALNSP
jgi:hypothetical protein